MKKKFILFIITATFFTACKKENNPDVKPVDLKIKVSYDLSNSGYSLPLNGLTVKLKRHSNNTIRTLSTNEDGELTFPQTAAGKYDIDVSITIPAATYTTMTGIPAVKDVNFNAALKNKTINMESTEIISLKMLSGVLGDWLIKQVYYAGSDRIEGVLFRDQFIEIYNNTDQVMYADSLFIGEIWGRQSSTSNTHQILANGQYNWAESIGMTTANGDPNTENSYVRALLMIPGNGKTYPIKAGESLILAQTAINHKSPFTGLDGESVSVRNPALTVDLSSANFEAYYAPFLSKPLNSDIDNPQVPNVDVLSYFGTDMILDNPGRTGFVIFKNDTPAEVKNWPQYNEPLIKVPTSTARKYYQIPNKYIIDAIEIQPNVVTSRVAKKLGADLDAGFTFVPKGAYTSQSVIRKTAYVDKGRVVLKDTNNSTEDFDFFDVAQPRGFK